MYPYQRHNWPPTLEIITHNFPKYQICQKFPKQIPKFSRKFSKLQTPRGRPQRWSIFRAMRCRWFIFQQRCDTDFFWKS